MVLNPLNMGKLRQGVMAVAEGLALAGCSEANAEGNDNTAEVQKVAAVGIPDTQAECLKLQSATQAEIMACMNAVTERDQLRMDAEIAALDAGLEQDAETIAGNIKADQLREQEKEKNNTNIEGLSSEVEGLKKDVRLQEGAK